MINVAFIIDVIESPTAGTEKQLVTLIKGLDRSVFNPYLCALRRSAWLEEEFDLCPVHFLDAGSFRNPKTYLNILKFSRFLKKNNIDILQTHFRDSNIAGILAAKIAGTKTVISTRRNQGYWHTSLDRVILRLINRWVDCFISNSMSTKAWATGVEGIPPEKISVIHNGMDLEPFRASRSFRKAVRAELGIKDTAPVAGIVANLRPVKGLDVFLMAAALVKKSLPEARFLIIGEGPERKNLQKLSSALGLDKSVLFLGRRQDIPRLLGALDAGALTSHSESFSNAVVEYLAAGLPVVCTDVGGCREAVEDGVNGFVVRPGDHVHVAEGLLKVLGGGLSGAMSEESRRKAESLFSLPTMMKNYEEFYLAVCGHGKAVAKERVAYS
jgi:glycosyltransferase involved in cell wall biosynthesis